MQFLDTFMSAGKMSKQRNSPERLLHNLRGAPATMQLVDAHLKEDTENLFIESLARILDHQEVDSGCLNRYLDKSLRSEICLLLISAIAELETAWNVIRLSNVPASRRQSRVASELLALAVLVALPRDKICQLHRKLSLVKILKGNPERTLVDLYKPNVRKQGKSTQVIDPAIKGSVIYPAFLRACGDILGVPSRIVDNLRDYQKKVQHPSSHASVDLWVFHFEGFDNGRAGALYSPERADSYSQAGDDLANIAHWFAEILGLTASRLATNDWSKWA